MHIPSLFLSYVNISNRVKESPLSRLNCIISLDAGFALKYTPFTIDNGNFRSRWHQNIDLLKTRTKTLEQKGGHCFS